MGPSQNRKQLRGGTRGRVLLRLVAQEQQQPQQSWWCISAATAAPTWCLTPLLATSLSSQCHLYLVPSRPGPTTPRHLPPCPDASQPGELLSATRDLPPGATAPLAAHLPALLGQPASSSSSSSPEASPCHLTSQPHALHATSSHPAAFPAAGQLASCLPLPLRWPSQPHALHATTTGPAWRTTVLSF